MSAAEPESCSLLTRELRAAGLAGQPPATSPSAVGATLSRAPGVHEYFGAEQGAGTSLQATSGSGFHEGQAKSGKRGIQIMAIDKGVEC